ncbi:MAG: hypothetical protein Kow0025_14830 [Thermodesulfovibrionales bacterium]
MNRDNKEETGAGETRVPPAPSFFVTLAVLGLLAVAGLSVGYYYYRSGAGPAGPQKQAARPAGAEQGRTSTLLSLYYPVEGHLKFENREARGTVSQVSIAEAAVGEFLKGPSGGLASYVPPDTTLLGVYAGDDGILYIDLSDEFRRNFRGDAMEEFLLLKALFETVVSNVYGIEGVKVLVEGKEAETLGGHISLLRPLGETVSRPAEGGAAK